MWLESFRDLQWRRRRFAIAVAATALVFALSLLLSGVSASFNNEVERTVEVFRADAWVVGLEVSGPFTASSTLPESMAGDVAELPGVERADPIAIARRTVRLDGEIRDLNLFGHRLGGVGVPRVATGRTVRDDGEVVTDRSLGLDVGDRLPLAGSTFRVVGLVEGITFFAGQPTAFMTLDDVQRVGFAGEPLAQAVVTRGVPRDVPGHTVLSNAEVVSDLRRPLKNATQTINFINVLLWVVAGGILGSIAYLSALERVRDFAVFKATGLSTGSLLAGLAFQAVVLAGAAAAVAAVIAVLLGPRFAMTVEIPRSGYITLPVVAIGVGLLASLAGLRRAVAVDPATAFAGA